MYMLIYTNTDMPPAVIVSEDKEEIHEQYISLVRYEGDVSLFQTDNNRVILLERMSVATKEALSAPSQKDTSAPADDCITQEVLEGEPYDEIAQMREDGEPPAHKP